MNCIQGQKLVSVRTICSKFDNECIVFTDDKDNQYKMDVKEILKINKNFNDCLFEIEKKKVHSYLHVVI